MRQGSEREVVAESTRTAVICETELLQLSLPPYFRGELRIMKERRQGLNSVVFPVLCSVSDVYLVLRVIGPFPSKIFAREIKAIINLHGCSYFP